MKKLKLILATILGCLMMCCGVFAACGGDGGDGSIYFVTFDYNYSGAPEAEVQNVKSGNTAVQPEDPVREGYEFDGWHTDAACTQDFSFDTKIEADTTVYAGWKTSANYWTLTFDLSQFDMENETVLVPKGESITEPEIIVPGWQCQNWYTDEAKTNKWLWGLAITQDMTLYGEWAKQYTFEAEYCDNIKDLTGAGFSGNTSGLNMIEKDVLDKGASNGFYVNYLYKEGLYLQFTIESETDVTGAKMYMRLSTEIISVNLTGDLFEVSVTDANGSKMTYDYPEISIEPASSGTSGEKADFKDYLVTQTLSLKKGKNVIVLKVANSDLTLGTMTAYAPLVDAIKITTDAELEWVDDCDVHNIDGK